MDFTVFAQQIANGLVNGMAYMLIAIGLATLSDEPLDRIARTISAAVHEQAIALGGTIGAGHGIGQSMRDALAAFKRPAEMASKQGIKQPFDPQGLINPGKVVAARRRQSTKSQSEGPLGQCIAAWLRGLAVFVTTGWFSGQTG